MASLLFKPNPISWVRPREGVIKANFDASLKQNHGTGLGVVFRDHYGEVLSVGSVLLPNCYEAHIIEVITFWGVAKMTVNLSFGLIQFKLDFQRLVQTWKNKDSTGNNYLDNVIKETRIVNPNSPNMLIFAHRSANKAMIFWLILSMIV